jgi:hypothetical protein
VTSPRLSLVVILLTACTDSGVLLDGEAKRIESEREFLDPFPVTLVDPHALAVPDSLELFNMSDPVRIAFADVPTCELMVADGLDRAIHIFDRRGAYETSIYGGGRDTSKLASIGDMVVSADGLVAVANPLSTIGFFRRDGSYSEFSVEKPDSTVISFSSLAVVGKSVFDHWMLGASKRFDYSPWADQTPIVLRYSLEGRLEGTLGHIRTFPGRLLNLAMNEGTLAAGRDTVWFGRRVDAVLIGYPVSGESARVLRLPLVHRMQPIREVPIPKGGGATEAVVEYHLHDFDVDERGNFYVVQALSWPRAAGAPFRPDLGLAVYSAAGEPLGLYDTASGEVRAVAVGGSFLYLIVLEPESRKLQVWRYRNPIGGDWGCS